MKSMRHKTSSLGRYIIALYFSNVFIQGTITGLGILSCIFYVVLTFFHSIAQAYGILFSSIEIVISSFFILDYVMCIITSHSKQEYIFSFYGLTDVVSFMPIIPSALFISGDIKDISFTWIGFLVYLRLFKIVQLRTVRYIYYGRSLSLEDAFFTSNSDVVYQVWRLIIGIIVLVFISTSTVYYISYLYPDSFSEELTWFDAFYFVVVSVATVGYGDIVATSELSRFVIITITIIGFGTIPIMAASLVQAIMTAPKYMGSFTSHHSTSHICLCGIVDFELMKRFITELFHSSHSLIYKDEIVLVILSPLNPTPQVIHLMTTLKFTKRIEYYVGSCKSFSDLNRIKASEAAVIYLIPDVITTSLKEEEDSIFLSALSISQYLKNKSYIGMKRSNSISHISSPSPRVLAKLTSSGRNKTILKTLGIDTVLSVQELKYSLLAIGTLIPGFLALFLNLTRSAKQHNKTTSNARASDTYTSSIFQIQPNDELFSPILKKIPFLEFIRRLYWISKGRVIAIGATRNSHILINPSQSSVLIEKYETLFLIASTYEKVLDYTSNAYDEIITPPVTLDRSRTESIQCKVNEKLFTAMERSKSNPNLCEEKINLQSRSTSTSSIKATYKLNPFISTVSKKLLDQPDDFTDELEEQIKNNKMLAEIDFGEYLYGHVVLIITSSKTALAQSIVLTLFYFLKMFRKYSSTSILILTDRANEIQEYLSELGEAHPSLLCNVQLVHGVGRNPDHLQMCRVTFAKAVVILRPPIAAESSEESQASESTRSLLLQDDRDTIITSLNLRMLLQMLDAGKTSTFTVSEIIHESNITFLRQGFDPNIARDEDEPDESSDDIYDWPILAAGSILTHSLFESIMVQVIYNPNLLNFWETALGIGTLGKFNDNISLKEGINASKNPNHHHYIGGLDVNSMFEEVIRPHDNTDDIPSSEFRDDGEKMKSQSTKESRTHKDHSRSISFLGKREIPRHMIGGIFSNLFEQILQYEHAIVISIYRLSNNNNYHIILTPKPNTVLKRGDSYFYFKVNSIK